MRLGDLDLSNGRLSEHPLAALLLSARDRGATGVLRIEGRGGTSRLYLRQGAPAGAHVAVGFRPLGQVLVQNGLVDLETLDRALPQLEKGRPLPEVLREMGALDEGGLREGMRLQLVEHLRALARLADGRFEFRQEDPPGWTADLSLDADSCIAEALASPGAQAYVVETLARLGPRVLRLGERFEELASRLQLASHERDALESWREGGGPEDLVARGVEPGRASWLAAVLVALGGVEAVDPIEE